MNLDNKRCKSEIYRQEDMKLSIALMTPFVVLTGQYFILTLLGLLSSTNNSIVQYISKVLVAFMFIYTLPIVFKRRKSLFLFVYFGAVFIYLINFIIFPENFPYIKAILFPFFFMCLPAFIYSLCIYDFLVLKRTMKKTGLIVFIFGAAIGILVILGKANIGDYSMTLSYYMLVPAIIFLDDMLEKTTLKGIVITLFSVIIILLLGSRGAILCIIVFFVFKLIRPFSKMGYKRLFFYTIFMCIVITLFIYRDRTIEYLYKTFLQMGIHSRTLELFLFDKGHLSGRDVIYTNVIDAIYKSPLSGIGIGGDRRVNGGEGYYAHNFFLELLSNFGVLFGGILIITIALLIFKILFSKDRGIYNIGTIWISLGFIPLMVSGSYLTDIKYWIFAGLIMNFSLRKKYKVKSEILPNTF